MGNSSRRLNVVLRAAEVILLVVGLLSIAWYVTARMAAAREQASLSRDLDQFARAATAPARTAAAPQSLVGRIEMPRLNLSAIAREGVDDRTLRVAIGHIPGTAFPGQPGNAGFAAHRDTFFRPLKSVRKGDDVIVTTPAGIYRYSVTGMRIVDPDDVWVLDPTPDTSLTLVTCYPFNYVGSAPQRFIVRATLTR
jgi:sortase A